MIEIYIIENEFKISPTTNYIVEYDDMFLDMCKNKNGYIRKWKTERE